MEHKSSDSAGDGDGDDGVYSSGDNYSGCGDGDGCLSERSSARVKRELEEKLESNRDGGVRRGTYVFLVDTTQQIRRK